MIPHIYNGNGTISMMLDGVMKPVDTAHRFYAEIKQALKDKNWSVIPGLVNIKEQVQAAINASTVQGVVTIKDGQVFYNNIAVHNTLTDRIVSMAKDGFDIAHMVKFLENLMTNPSYRAVNELYDFLEAGQIPITENGTFLTYKKIRSDWKDIHSGKFDNSVGTKVSMPRNMVDENSAHTCSSGLHVCSYNYLPHFGSSSGERVVVCEVNPSDVVSIPTDYNNTKMRVCAYTVIGEVKDYTEKDILANQQVVRTKDVRFGNLNGTVQSDSSKRIGKTISEALDGGFISNTDLYDICEAAGLDELDNSDLLDIADSKDTKRVGKKIKAYIDRDQMNAVILLDSLESLLESGKIQ
jgi:hypothetical protein